MFRPAFPFPTSFMEDLGEEFIQIWMPVPGNLASPEGSPSCDPVKDATLPVLAFWVLSFPQVLS